MTGVGGRPEVIIEGSDNAGGPWKEYHFMYKPGNVTEAPPTLFGHQARLDWQLWFAALGSYQQNPWFISLLQRILDRKLIYIYISLILSQVDSINQNYRSRKVNFKGLSGRVKVSVFIRKSLWCHSILKFRTILAMKMLISCSANRRPTHILGP